MNRAVPRLVALTVLTVVSGCQGASSPGPATEPISVVTRNLYLGAELSPLFLVSSVDELAARAGEIWRQIKASHFEERATVLAGEIVDAHADVVALQEVSLFRTQSPGDWQSGAAPNATDVDTDFLQILLDALTVRGASYMVVAAGSFTDQEVPAVTAEGVSLDLRLTDRNVLLARQGLSATEGPHGAFSTNAAIPTGGPGGATLTLERGYVSADITVGARTVRVVDSHLEVGGVLKAVQQQQAGELMAALAGDAGRSLILAGDFNSPADGSGTTSYAQLTGGASRPFRDPWPLGHPPVTDMGRDPGYTCCLDLGAAEASPQERIDLLLFRGNVEPGEVTVVQPVKTPSGLWPSDHLGVSAQFLF
jgi:endonuclease/exonuclease/phosphatase family metal-dependent hydrolase